MPGFLPSWTVVRPGAKHDHAAIDRIARTLQMNRTVLLVGAAIALSGQSSFAKNRLTDPIKIARECKSEVELFCKAVRPGGNRIIRCLQGKANDLSPACSAAVKSTQ